MVIKGKIMKKEIEKLIQHALKNLEIKNVDFSVEHPDDFKNGDYSTNVAMVYKIDPEKIKELIDKNLPKGIEKIEIKNKFINFYLSQEFFTDNIKNILNQSASRWKNWGKNKILAGQKIMVEYTDPNPFKPFHIGHLMSNAIGESVSRIVEFSGAKIVRANYQGDVGPHVAKAIYELMKHPNLPLTSPQLSSCKEEEELGSGSGEAGGGEWAQFIGECYVKGNQAYENDENIKKEIDEINKKIYTREDKKINQIYDWGRKITLDAFEEIYKLLGTKFDKYYFESQMASIGVKIVKENTRKSLLAGRQVFEKSDGAIIFKAEKFDSKLHTRVFVNSQGLPTYEAKELGLALTKFKKNLFGKKLDLSIVLTGKEQYDYMRVVAKAISLMHPNLENKMKHIPHGLMTLPTGKMSSRKGNAVTGESLIKDSLIAIRKKIKDRDFSESERKQIARMVGVSAIKYSILKSAIESDIIYDFEKSISFEGDSGPYLQYTAVRANSILEKAKEFSSPAKGRWPEVGGVSTPSALGISPLTGGEKKEREVLNLERLLYQFPEIAERAYQDFAPHHIATYLTKLASAFNTFYGNTKILDENNKNINYHLDLVKAFYQTMKNGLWLLGIETPDRM